MNLSGKTTFQTLLLTLLGCWPVFTGHALELTYFGARVEATYGAALAKGMQGRDLESALQLDLNAELKLSHALDFIVSTRLKLDGEQEYVDPGNSFSSYSHPSRTVGIGEAGYLDLDDAYLELTTTNVALRLGKQQIVWGALDGLKVTDVLNPQRFREFILEPFADSRISTFSAYGDVSFGDWRLELAWLPDETTHDFAEEGDWFAFTAPRFRLGAPSGNIPAGAGPVVRGRPRPELEHGAARLTAMFGGTTLRAIAAHTLDYEPLIEVFAGAAQGSRDLLQRSFRSVRMYGLTAETAVGPFALRAEGAYRPDRFFNTVGLNGVGIARQDQWTAAVAADLNGPLDTFINVQYLFDKVEGDAALVRPSEDRIITAFVRRQFLYDTLTIDLRWYSDRSEKDALYRADISYALGDNTTIGLNVDVFDGDAAGLFGQFARRDRASFSITHTL